MWILSIFQIKGLVACSECRIRNGGGQKFASQPKPSNVMIVSLHRLNNEQKAICFTCFSSAEICSASAFYHLLRYALHLICFWQSLFINQFTSALFPSLHCSFNSSVSRTSGSTPLWKSIISVWFFQISLYGGPCHRNHCWILIQLKSDLNWLTTFRLQSSVHPSRLDCHPKTS